VEPRAIALDNMPVDAFDFVQETMLWRRELLAHCYRMLGSVDDAEDLVQETYLRAWSSYNGFEKRSSARAWLYRIATNACLSALKRRDRRVLPSGLGDPAQDSEAAPVSAESDVLWLQPIPDILVGAPSKETAVHDPAEIVAAQEGLRLALVASLQYLPARQRAVLILRDVLAFSAAEVADMLGISTAAVKSMLQRARARLEEAGLDEEEIIEPADPRLRKHLDRYIAAFEDADAAALQELLRHDATLEATPLRTWLAGQRACVPFLARHVLRSPGYWRMYATSANGQPAAIAYRRSDGDHHPGGTYLAYGVIVLTTTRSHIARIVAFADSNLVVKFGFPMVLEGSEVDQYRDMARVGFG
jgi:RNA polymerase sigma-70 factor, ECF subfamily